MEQGVGGAGVGGAIVGGLGVAGAHSESIPRCSEPPAPHPAQGYRPGLRYITPGHRVELHIHRPRALDKRRCPTSRRRRAREDVHLRLRLHIQHHHLVSHSGVAVPRPVEGHEGLSLPGTREGVGRQLTLVLQEGDPERGHVGLEACSAGRPLCWCPCRRCRCGCRRTRHPHCPACAPTPTAARAGARTLPVPHPAGGTRSSSRGTRRRASPL